MEPNEITPAQRRLLDKISPREANDIYKDLSTTLSMAICSCIGESAEHEPSPPTVSAMTSWVRVIEIMDAVQELGMEKQS